MRLIHRLPLLTLFRWNYRISGRPIPNFGLPKLKRCSQLKISRKRRQNLAMLFAFYRPDTPQRYVISFCGRQNNLIKSLRLNWQNVCALQNDNDYNNSFMSKTSVTANHHSSCGICWNFAAMPSSTPTEMRFFANFFYRNYPSPFARHWQPTKMLLSISSPRWRTTWPRCKALNHQFIRFRKKMTPKLQPYNPNYWRSAKCCNPDQRTSNDRLTPSRAFVGTTSASVLMQRSAASLASFARNRETRPPVGERGPHDWQLSTSPRFW